MNDTYIIKLKYLQIRVKKCLICMYTSFWIVKHIPHMCTTNGQALCTTKYA